MGEHTQRAVTNPEKYMTDTKHTDSVEAVVDKLSYHKENTNGTAEITDLKATCFTMDDVQQQVEAITHAIMTAVHEQEERDDTPYPKIRTHTLAGIIKSLVPSFSYHGYIKRMTEREVEEAVRKRNGVIKEYKDEGVMFVLKVEDGKTYEASMPIPKWAEVGKITMRTHNHQD